MNCNPFNTKVLVIKKDKLTFHFINMDNYDDVFKKFINVSIASIWNGVFGDDDLEVVKLELKNWFVNKDYKKR